MSNYFGYVGIAVWHPADNTNIIVISPLKKYQLENLNI